MITQCDLDEQRVVEYCEVCVDIRYLVGVSAAVAVHSLLQLLINVSRMLRKSPVIPSRNHAWLIFAGDQVINGCKRKIRLAKYMP